MFRGPVETESSDANLALFALLPATISCDVHHTHELAGDEALAITRSLFDQDPFGLTASAASMN